MDLRRLWRVVIAFVVLAVTFHFEAAMAASRTLSGTVTYRERIALPPSAVVEVELVEVSLADAPSITIAETSVNPSGQVPVPYELRFDDAVIKPGQTYSLQARVMVDGRLWFTTTSRHQVLAGGTDDTNIMVQRVTADVASAAGLAGRWLAEDIRGGGVIDNLQTVLEIAADGSVSGSGGCNSMRGQSAISGDRIAFGSIASTLMGCEPAVSDQEEKFFAALGDVRAWRIDPEQNKLVLFDGQGKAVILLARM